MRNLILILCLLAFDAGAANLRFAFVSSGGTVTVNIPDFVGQQEARFVNWLWEFYGPTDTTPGSPTFGQKLTRNAANEAVAYRRWVRATTRGTFEQVRAWEIEQLKASQTTPTMPAEQ